MTVDLATVGIAVDTSQVKTAATDLDKLGDAGARLEGATNRVTQQTAQMTQVVQQSATATQQAAAAQDKLTIGQTAFIEKLQRQAAAAGLSGAELLRLQAAEMGLSGVTEDLIAKIESASQAQSGHTLSMGSSLAKMEMLRVGHDALIGSYTRMGSSLFVLGNATGATTALFSAAALPALALAAAIAAIAIPAAAVYTQMNQINQALKETGDVSGQTTGGVMALAQALGNANHNIDATNDILVGLINTGHVTQDTLKEMGAAATSFAVMTGQSADDVVKEFAKMDGNVSKFALDFDEHYHMLDNDIYEHIKQLQLQGDKEQAMNLLSATIHAETQARIDEAKSKIGGLARVWDSAMNAAKGYWEMAKSATSYSFGMAAPEQEQALRKQRKANPVSRAILEIEDHAKGYSGDERDQQLESQIASETAKSQAEGLHKQQQTAANNASDAIDKLVTTYDRNVAKQRALNDVKKQFQALALANDGNPLMTGVSVDGKGNVSGGAYDTITAGIEKEYAPKEKKAPKERDTEPARVKGLMDAQAQQLALEKEGIAERTRLLDLEHQHNLVSDADYYAQKRSLDDAQSNATINSLKAQITAEQSLTVKDAAGQSVKDNRLASLRAQLELQEQINKDRKEYLDREQAILAPEREFADLQKQASELKKREGEQVALVQAQVKSYQLTSIDGQKVINGLSQDYATQLSDILAKMKALSTANPQLKNASSVEAGLQGEINKSAQSTGAPKDPWFEARESLQKYVDDSKKGGDTIGGALNGAFKGAEDAFASFTTTGKLNFSSLAQSILADIERILLRKAIAGMVDMAVGAFGGSGSSYGAVDGAQAAVGSGFSMSPSFGGGRAGGGDVQPGMQYQVGENGPEILRMGSGGGTIIPNSQIASSATSNGAGVQIIMNVDVQSGTSDVSSKGTDSQQAVAFTKLLGDKVRQIILDEKRNGGLLA
ncbi:phage tail length tape measure family protein [Collimonas humicola]|uniref:phage tail length tape measure family protein n=1 Tax=Collimonas humicola TaxID=2825886 RepID=UPI001B8B538F|nr:phage tail length tape measure family protein [Collimonas humicola]